MEMSFFFFIHNYENTVLGKNTLIHLFLPYCVHSILDFFFFKYVISCDIKIFLPIAVCRLASDTIHRHGLALRVVTLSFLTLPPHTHTHTPPFFGFIYFYLHNSHLPPSFFPPLRNYHVFYYLLAGSTDREREALHLLQADRYIYLSQVGKPRAPRKRDSSTHCYRYHCPRIIVSRTLRPGF